MSDDGILKSAILLMSLGEEEAAEVFKYLGPKEVQKLSEAMSSLNNVKRDKIESVVNEFCTLASDRTSLGQNSLEYIRKVLIRALGEEKAANLLDRMMERGNDTSGTDTRSVRVKARVEQSSERKKKHLYEGRLMHGSEVAKAVGIPVYSLRYWLKKGMSIEAAVIEALRRKK